MANLIRCSKGHFYDTDKYRACPYCAQTGTAGPTTPLTEHGEEKLQLPATDVKNKRAVTDDMDATVGYYEAMKHNPVVGWLVSIEGTTKGMDFRVCSGRNYIGRGANMDIVLEGDNMVSREKHAIIIFDPVSQMTLCQSGESRELFYLNGRVVTDAVALNKGDILTIGRTKLMFVPFCGELFAWDAQG